MPHDRPRVTLKRLLLFLALALLLGLLLEMNRWLPGGWPGGGDGGGLRQLSVARGEAQRLTPPETPSPERVPLQGVLVEVRGPDGTALEGWRAGVGGAAETRTPAAGELGVQVQDPALHTVGVRIHYPAGHVRHVPPEGLSPSPRWRVQVPTNPVEQLKQPSDLVVQVRDAVSGEPVAEAEVLGPERPAPTLTDANGRAVLAGVRDRAQVRVRKPGYQETVAVGHAGSGQPLDVRLAALQNVPLTFVDEAGQPVPVSAARLVDADGELLWQSDSGAAPSATHVARVPADRRAGATLTLEAPRRPQFETALPEPGAPVVLPPEGRRIVLMLRDANGAPVGALRARVRYAAPEVSGRAPSERESAGVDLVVPADASGRIEALVPARGEATLVVESAAYAPEALTVSAADSSGTRDVVLAPGLRVPVHVLDERGRPVRAAQVRVACLVGGVRVEATALTDAEGLARVGPLQKGRVEIYARAAGKAWNGLERDVAENMGAVELRLFRGGPIRLVVESPLGAPLAHVHVTLTPSDDGPPDMRPPDAAPWQTDARGLLILDDVPLSRSYRVGLALLGHTPETLHDVRAGNITYFATLTPQP